MGWFDFLKGERERKKKEAVERIKRSQSGSTRNRLVSDNDDEVDILMPNTFNLMYDSSDDYTPAPEPVRPEPVYHDHAGINDSVTQHAPHDSGWSWSSSSDHGSSSGSGYSSDSGGGSYSSDSGGGSSSGGD